jgi:hypothetical protein
MAEMADKVEQTEKALFIRYPEEPWVLFDMNSTSITHQKEGLELYLNSGLESLAVSIPHAQGGLFEVTFEKIVNDKGILYYYTRFNQEAVQMMYAEPAYAAYINRLTT